MRIAVDGHAFASPAGGVRRYVTELARAIARVDPSCSITAIGPPATARLPDGVQSVAAAPSLPSNLGWALTGLPLTARRAACDLFHAPAYTAPLWGVRPLVVTIHDVSYARQSAWYPHANGAARRAFYRASALRADRVITDSDFSRSEIVAAYGIAPDRIAVIPLAAADAFSPDARVRRDRFVLHVGDLHPRRNLEMLLDMVIALRRQDAGCADVQLVLAGVDRGSLAGLLAQAERGGAASALRYVGAPDDAALAALYRTAGVFAYPSRYEGFGLPVLEAMTCGAPVVATASGAVPEITGPRIPTLGPDDRGGWLEAIRRLLTDSAAAHAAGVESLARAAAFSWDHTAAMTIAVYRSALTAR